MKPTKSENLKKWAFTFGSGHLADFHVNSSAVILIVDAPTEWEARDIVLGTDGIGTKFCTSYPIEQTEDFIWKYGMSYITLDNLLKLKKEKHESY